jgi:hypothetical protein
MVIFLCCYLIILISSASLPRVISVVTALASARSSTGMVLANTRTASVPTVLYARATLIAIFLCALFNACAYLWILTQPAHTDAPYKTMLSTTNAIVLLLFSRAPPVLGRILNRLFALLCLSPPPP